MGPGVLGQGRIEVICGPMFSGKTEELIRRVRRALIAKQRVQIFKPSIDSRYSNTDVVSHSAQSIGSEVIPDSSYILERLHDKTRVVAIDEIQFFGPEVVMIVRKLVMRGIRVICAGLDLDYRGEPFGPMPELLALADEVQKVHAICTVCGAAATRSQRIKAKPVIKNSNSKNNNSVDDATVVQVGSIDSYEARCLWHHDYDERSLDEIVPANITANIPANMPSKEASKSSKSGRRENNPGDATH